MTDWATISSLATAGGTLVLAVATFASVRSANRAARAAEESLLDGLRPLRRRRRAADHHQFGMIPAKDPDSGERTWYAVTNRHWTLDRANPR